MHWPLYALVPVVTLAVTCVFKKTGALMMLTPSNQLIRLQKSAVVIGGQRRRVAAGVTQQNDA